MLAIIVWTISDIISISFLGIVCIVLLGIYLHHLALEWIRDFKDWLKGMKAKRK